MEQLTFHPTIIPDTLQRVWKDQNIQFKNFIISQNLQESIEIFKFHGRYRKFHEIVRISGDFEKFPVIVHKIFLDSLPEITKFPVLFWGICTGNFEIFGSSSFFWKISEFLVFKKN